MKYRIESDSNDGLQSAAITITLMRVPLMPEMADWYLVMTL